LVVANKEPDSLTAKNGCKENYTNAYTQLCKVKGICFLCGIVD
jgi:hypothetical protein